MSADLPPALREILARNERELAAAAERLGAAPGAIPSHTSAEWIGRDVAYDEIRVVECSAPGGLRATVIVNEAHIYRTSAGPGRAPTTTWRLEHFLAVARPDAAVTGPLATVAVIAPIVGDVRLPHFANAGAKTGEAHDAWTRSGGPPPRDLFGGFRFVGCVDGILYGWSEAEAIEAGAIERSLRRLAELAADDWRAPTPDERHARVAVTRRAGKTGLVVGCVGSLLVLAVLAWALVQALASE